MKKLYKIILSFAFVVLINTFAQTNSHGHGVISAIAIFSNAMASDHTAEKQVIKELKLKIYNLGAEPVKKRILIGSYKKYILQLKEQLSELEKDNSINELRSSIEKEIEELGGKPITKVTDIDRDEQIVALRKQLENLKIIKAEKDQPKKEKLKALKKEIEDEIISLGAEPVTK